MALTKAELAALRGLRRYIIGRDTLTLFDAWRNGWVDTVDVQFDDPADTFEAVVNGRGRFECTSQEGAEPFKALTVLDKILSQE